MRLLFPMIAAGAVLIAAPTLAHRIRAEGPYHVEKVEKVGGEGGFDYVYADSDARKLYVPRLGPAGHVSVFNLDSLAPVGEIPNTSAHGVATDTATHHGFASSSPVAMWDTRTLRVIKTIPVEGRPDGILNDTYNHHTYVFSHSEPNVTVLDDADGRILSTIDLGGAPEQAAADGNGRLYVDIENKGSVAVVDASAMKMVTEYSLGGKGGGNAGLSLDPRHHVLFVACREPQVMVMLDSNDGKYLAELPIGQGCDGTVFNGRTDECFSSQGDGTLTVVRESGHRQAEVEQTVRTMPGAKTCTLDRKTGRILLITAQWGPAPAGGEGGGFRRRGPMMPGSFSIIDVGK